MIDDNDNEKQYLRDIQNLEARIRQLKPNLHCSRLLLHLLAVKRSKICPSIVTSRPEFINPIEVKEIDEALFEIQTRFDAARHTSTKNFFEALKQLLFQKRFEIDSANRTE